MKISDMQHGLWKYFAPAFLKERIDNIHDRKKFVQRQLSLIPSGRILDAGAGSQQFRSSCSHMDYVAQDFAKYSTDETQTLAREGGIGGVSGYKYGETDIVSDICSIPCPSSSFDAILCTEVLEHVPYPSDALKELSRLLKPGGKLILTVPSNCLRHMDPYFFFSGFSDRWIEKILDDNALDIETIEPVGDYYRWLFVEICRVIRFNFFTAALPLISAALYFYFKKSNHRSIATLCMGYHVVAVKKREDRAGAV